MIFSSKENSFSSDFFDFVKSNTEMVYRYCMRIPLFPEDCIGTPELIMRDLDRVLLKAIFNKYLDKDISLDIDSKIFEEKLDDDFSFFDVIDAVDMCNFQYDSVILSMNQSIEIHKKIDKIYPSQLATKSYVDAVISDRKNYYSFSYCGKMFKVMKKLPDNKAVFIKEKLGCLYFKDRYIMVRYIHEYIFTCRICICRT